MKLSSTRVHLAMLLPWALLVTSVLLVVFQAERPAALPQLWRPWAEIGALAAVMTAVIITGGIDLSVGSIVALCGVVTGTLWQDFDVPIGLASFAGVATGFVAGGVNGTLVAIGIAPLVATLATMAFFAGLAMAIAAGRRIPGLPESFTHVGQGNLLGVPLQFWLMAVVFAAAYVIVHHTRQGRYLFAIGDNRLAAEYAAVRVRLVEWWVYALTGLVAGVVALAYTARGGAAIPTAGTGLELQVIACVVIGGTSVTGGYGGVGRTLLGITALANLDLGLQLFASNAFDVPWSDTPWRLSADGRLIAIGALVIALAVWNERVGKQRITSIKRSVTS